MEEKEYRKTNRSVSFLVQQLYGMKSYQELKNYQDIKLAKKYYLKLIKSFSLAIEQTIEIIDTHQMASLNEILNHGQESIKQCSTFSDLDQSVIAIQARLIFQLLGQVPNRWKNKDIQNRKENWKFNKYRQIQYTQTPGQKKDLVFGLIQRKYMDRFGSWSDFVLDIYKGQCDGNPHKLMKFLALNHPDIYREIT